MQTVELRVRIDRRFRDRDKRQLLRERIASLALDWPAVGFLKIEPGDGELRVTLATRGRLPAWVTALAVRRAIRRELMSRGA
jgi:hypothetical protein